MAGDRAETAALPLLLLLLGLLWRFLFLDLLTSLLEEFLLRLSALPLLTRDLLLLPDLFLFLAELDSSRDLLLVCLTAGTLCCLFPATLGLGSAPALICELVEISGTLGPGSEGGPGGSVIDSAWILRS